MMKLPVTEVDLLLAEDDTLATPLRMPRKPRVLADEEEEVAAP
jgi:hypothetical protein